MGVDLVAGTGVGAFLGYWIDKWFETAPIFFIALLILGFVTGIRNVVNIARKAQDTAESED
jgi:ATP synthase protein I